MLILSPAHRSKIVDNIKRTVNLHINTLRTERRKTKVLDGRSLRKKFQVLINKGLVGWSTAGGDRTGTSGGNTQRAEQTRTTQSAGNKHGAQQ